MGSLCLLQMFMFLSLCSNLSAQSETNAASSLNTLLQDYSFRSFVNPRTGIIYEANVPSNLTGIKLSAMRLRSGSLRKRGVFSFKEFSIPSGVIVKPYVTRLVLVYQNLANLSNLYYSLSGYDFVAPVLGLLAYDAKNLSAINLPELDLSVSNDPIKIDFSDLVHIPQGSGSNVKCVRFDSQGHVIIGESIQNTCETKHQGHFTLVVRKKKSSESKSKTLIIIGSVIGGLILLSLLLFLVLRCLNYKKKERLREMEKAGETSEALRMTYVGETRAPTATTTRTQPMLETEYAT